MDFGIPVWSPGVGWSVGRSVGQSPEEIQNLKYFSCCISLKTSCHFASNFWIIIVKYQQKSWPEGCSGFAYFRARCTQVLEPVFGFLPRCEKRSGITIVMFFAFSMFFVADRIRSIYKKRVGCYFASNFWIIIVKCQQKYWPEGCSGFVYFRARCTHVLEPVFGFLPRCEKRFGITIVMFLLVGFVGILSQIALGLSRDWFWTPKLVPFWCKYRL